MMKAARGELCRAEAIVYARDLRNPAPISPHLFGDCPLEEERKRFTAGLDRPVGCLSIAVPTGTLHFGEPPQPEGRCTNDRRSRLHRFEALVTRGRALPSRASLPSGSPIERRTANLKVGFPLTQSARGNSICQILNPGQKAR